MIQSQYMCTHISIDIYHKCTHIFCVHFMCTQFAFCGIIPERGDCLAYTKESYEAAKKYKSEKIKRVPLDMQKEDYETLKAAADAMGERVNEFIKKAIRQRLEHEMIAGVVKTKENVE